MSVAVSNSPAHITSQDPRLISEWDTEVAALPGAEFFHSQAWARVLGDSYGYTPYYLTARVGTRLTGLLPLMEVDSWVTGRRGVSLPFSDACAAVGNDAATIEQLTDAAWTLGRKHRWRTCELRGGTETIAATRAISFHRHTLDLTPRPEALLQRIDESNRRAIRKAERSGLQIELSQDWSAVRAFHQLLCATRKRHGLPPQPLRFFAALHRHVIATRKGIVFLARKDGQAVAGAVFLHFGHRALFKFGASFESAQSLRPNNFIFARAIAWHAAAGFKTLDFGRTDLGHEGLRRFKLSWGTDESTVSYVRRDLRSGEFVIRPSGMEGWHNVIFQHLPVFCSRLLGSALYRHLG